MHGARYNFKHTMESGVMRVDGNKKGAFTRDRQPKAVAFLLRDRWLRKADYLD